MTDVKNLLKRALTDGPATHQLFDHTPDPARDLHRAKAPLRRRRAAFAGTAAVLALGAGLVPLALDPGKNAGDTSATAPVTPVRMVEMASYTGKQVPGYRISQVPKGWAIQGNTPNSLTLAPATAKNTVPGDHLGKLVISVLPKAPKQPTTSTAQKINGQPGWLVKSSEIDVKAEHPKKLAALPPSVRQELTQINAHLTYRLADGRWIEIVAPASLGWDTSYLAKFASSVKVLDSATAGH
jgi:hypothetical protein